MHSKRLRRGLTALFVLVNVRFWTWWLDPDHFGTTSLHLVGIGGSSSGDEAVVVGVSRAKVIREGKGGEGAEGEPGVGVRRWAEPGAS